MLLVVIRRYSPVLPALYSLPARTTHKGDGTPPFEDKNSDMSPPSEIFIIIFSKFSSVILTQPSPNTIYNTPQLNT